MPTTRIIRPKPGEIRSKIVDTTAKTVETISALQTQVIHRKKSKKAACCPRSNHSNKCESIKTQCNVHCSKCARKAKSIETSPKSQDTTTTQPRALYDIQRHKAFTVIAPNPRKRHEIQKKAEAELAALEDLQLSRAMGYVSIAPCSVGGRLTLEEVRKKQQQEMQGRRRQNPVKKCARETSPVDDVVLNTKNDV